MRVRGTRFELSEAEVRIMCELASKELMRQIKKNRIDDHLTSILTKLTRAVKKSGKKGE